MFLKKTKKNELIKDVEVSTVSFEREKNRWRVEESSLIWAPASLISSCLAAVLLAHIEMPQGAGKVKPYSNAYEKHLISMPQGVTRGGAGGGVPKMDHRADKRHDGLLMRQRRRIHVPPLTDVWYRCSFGSPERIGSVRYRTYTHMHVD